MPGEPPAWAAHLPAGVDHAAVDLLAERSLPAAIARRAAAAPDRPALGRAGGGWLTRGELDEATTVVAGRLHQAGLRSGDRVAFSAAASLPLVVVYLAALRLSLVVVPVNPAYSERELGHVIGDAEPRAAVVDDRDRAASVRRAAGSDVLVVGPEVDLPDGAPPALDQGGPEEEALICYTSGTTGSPKGAVLSHGNLLAGAEAVRLAWRWDEADRLVLALPLFHVHGLCIGLNGTLLTGASAVLVPRFEAGAVLDAAADHDATLFFGVPTMYARLADSPRAAELGRLRLCVSGSAPLPAALFERLAELSGQRVLERYGLTETLMNVSNPYDGERRPGTVGLPLPGVSLRLASDGEVLVRGPSVFTGYWHDPDATAAGFDPEGWFRTGDLARFDERGYLRIEGRSKELVISGGYNVHPREVEEVLLTHPGVAEAAVTGTPSEEWGEVVTAWVVPDGPPPATDELIAFAAEHLAPYKRPRLIHYLDALPRNALGKVQRHELGTG
ncbi:MAG TPA: acyl-CoA synthetase [Actinomycetota bacterium]|nr:acyl-CoA synthetase [Actinomycetota bacterium]